MASVTFLKVLTRSDNKMLGTLTMHYWVGPQGQISQGWEWVGVNASTDGGKWYWVKTDSGKVSVALESGVYNRVVSNMYAERWNNGAFPPNAPWFVEADPYDWENELHHYGPNGSAHFIAIWLPK